MIKPMPAALKIMTTSNEAADPLELYICFDIGVAASLAETGDPFQISVAAPMGESGIPLP